MAPVRIRSPAPALVRPLLPLIAPETVRPAAGAGAVRAKIVCEAANLPTTPAADKTLADKGITVLPDLLVNAGGVIASYFEWTQNLQQIPWSEDRVTRELNRYLGRAYRDVAARARREGTTLRRAAYAIAIDRVARAEELRGTGGRR